jgi:creatinine amidohydrolase
MRLADLNWMQVASIVEHDDRALLPIGSTEQHAYLSLATDSTLAERVALEAARPLGLPVFPVFSYGLTPWFMAYPGTVTLSDDTFVRAVGEILDGIAASGFRRILIVNGHGGNTPLHPLAGRWMAAHAGCRLKVHDWWKGPRTWAQVQATDPEASHASWMESFPWTRLAGVPMPAEAKPMTTCAPSQTPGPAETRAASAMGTSAASIGAPTRTRRRAGGGRRWPRRVRCSSKGGEPGGSRWSSRALDPAEMASL